MGYFRQNNQIFIQCKTFPVSAILRLVISAISKRLDRKLVVINRHYKTAVTHNIMSLSYLLRDDLLTIS